MQSMSFAAPGSDSETGRRCATRTSVHVAVRLIAILLEYDDFLPRPHQTMPGFGGGAYPRGLSTASNKLYCLPKAILSIGWMFSADAVLELASEPSLLDLCIQVCDAILL